MKPKTCKWTIEVEVAAVWVADGFNPSADQWKDAILRSMLGYARDHEVKVRLVKAPTEEQITAVANSAEE